MKLLVAGCSDLTCYTGNHQLTMWLCVNVFADMLETTAVPASSATSSTSPAMTPAEEDIAHYIGGFVCCKLRQRNSENLYRDLVNSLHNSEEPAESTLLFAKTRGGLLNLTEDAKCIFVQFEEVFRHLFPPSSVQLDIGTYFKACLDNDTVQNCFHSSTHSSTDIGTKDKVLSNMISLYFKVRVHRQCRNVLEKVRSMKHDSKKEKSLRSKLAK